MEGEGEREMEGERESAGLTQKSLQHSVESAAAGALSCESAACAPQITPSLQNDNLYERISPHIAPKSTSSAMCCFPSFGLLSAVQESPSFGHQSLNEQECHKTAKRACGLAPQPARGRRGRP
eukprot:833045-Pleurochrysis_carterae.AAC.1